MSNVVLGKRSRLALGLTAAAKTSLAAPGEGISDISHDHRRDTAATAGGRGVSGVRPGKFATEALTFGAESNRIHDRVLAGAWGQRGYIDLWPTGSAGPKLSGSGPISVLSLTLSLDNDSVAWSVQMAVDGLLE